MAINLSKGQTIDLAKPSGDDGGGLSLVRLGLGWDAKVVEKRRLFGGVKRIERAIDLDASALLVGGNEVVEVVDFTHLKSKDGSIEHTGDNLTGEGDGDDESIVVDLRRVPSTVEHVVFTVNSFSGETFQEVDNAFVRAVDSTTGDTELARYTLTGSGTHTALIMARLSRSGSGWSLTAIGEPARARMAQELVPVVLSLL